MGVWLGNRLISMMPNKCFAGLRLSAIIETFLFLALALFIDVMFGSADRFWGVSPHPFWIIVLLITVQYGTSDALFSALAASAALIAGKLPERPLDVDLYQYWAQLILNPVMWICAGLVLGELVNRHRLGRKEAEFDLQLSRERAEFLSREYSALEAAKGKVERQLTGQSYSSRAVLDALKALCSLKPHDVLPGVREIIKSTIRPRKFSLFLKGPNGLELGFSSGWSATESYSTRISEDTLLYQRVIMDRQVLCCADLEHEKILGKEGILAAPLAASAEDSDVLGLIKIEDIGFFDLNVVAIHTFSQVCELCARALRNAMDYGLEQKKESPVLSGKKRAVHKSFCSPTKAAKTGTGHQDALSASQRIDVSLDS